VTVSWKLGLQHSFAVQDCRKSAGTKHVQCCIVIIMQHSHLPQFASLYDIMAWHAKTIWLEDSLMNL
jgi:hypothetical protein